MNIKKVLTILGTLLLPLLVLAYFSFAMAFSFALPTVIFWAIIFLLRATLLKNRRKAWLYILNFFILLAILIVLVLAHDQYLNYKLEQLDLNGDGVFSQEEHTPEQQMYFEAMINDSGRIYLPIFGSVFSLISTFSLALVLRAYELVEREKRKPDTPDVAKA